MEALGISFRTEKEITTRFLMEVPDLDFESIDIIIELCKANESFSQAVLFPLVNF